jgi:hypothetical protein
MDRIRDFASNLDSEDLSLSAYSDAGDNSHNGDDVPPMIGTDERRMHVRAYNFWAQMLGERSYPSVDDLDLENLGDFGPNSVLLDFSAGVENPAISYVGDALRAECGLNDDAQYISDVPSRSLLSRLTDHYLQIIANQAPIGFEAEFVNDRDMSIAYRGILLPFSSDDDTIDFILGVINWKEVADGAATAELHNEIEEALRAAPALVAIAPAPIWADGPTSHNLEVSVQPAQDDVLDLGEEFAEGAIPDAASGLGDWLAFARDGAEAAAAADVRGRSALYQAVSRAYDFACAAKQDPESYAELLADSGIAQQERAPMTPIVKLVFGSTYDKTRVTEYATVLAHAEREAVPQGGLANYLDRYTGGVKALVKAERGLRAKPERTASSSATKAQERLSNVIPYGFVPCGDAGEAEFVVFVGRQIAQGQYAMVGVVSDDAALTEKVMAKAKTGPAAPHNPE